MSEATMRCKVRVNEVTRTINANGEIEYETVKLMAVYGNEGTENAKWSKWTPNASFSISISNPSAIGKLSSGHEYYVDFIPAV